jgi:hypothetical protein
MDLIFTLHDWSDLSPWPKTLVLSYRRSLSSLLYETTPLSLKKEEILFLPRPKQGQTPDAARRPNHQTPERGS